MALSEIASGGSVSVSSIKVTGNATAYTVPVGKKAKVRLVYFDAFRTGYSVYIGNYILKNDATQTLSSINQSLSSSPGTASIGIPVPGFVRGGLNAGFNMYYIYIKEEHDLVAGERVYANDATATFAYNIFEEDA
jgi:hypothetical protein